jgi:hypothetical protein
MSFRVMATGVVVAVALLWGTGCTPTAVAEDVTTQELTGDEGAKGQFCGGFAGIACPEGYACVDDPNDTCDPQQGGADCGGICQKSKCPKESEDLYYVSRNTRECPAILFRCPEGFSAFFNDCGCGCQRDVSACDDPSRTYVSRDPNQCAAIRFFCEPGQQAFFDDCGCGCEPAP